MAKQMQTRMGANMRKLADKVDTPAHPCPESRRKLETYAAKLDVTALALGLKTAIELKNTNAYKQALMAWKEVTGEDYVPHK